MPFSVLLIAYVSAEQSLRNILIAAAISTALFCFGLRGTKARTLDATPTVRKRERRWISMTGGVAGAMMTGFVAVVEDVRLWERSVGLITLIILALGLILIGAVLLRVGLRGRRVGDHPYCRKCGFDLFGRPENTTVCGECGASLVNEASAIIIGVRQRRMVPLAIGFFVLLMVVALSVPSFRDGYRWAVKKDWAGYKPDFWLVSDLKTGKTPADKSLNELFRRLQEDSLDGSTVAAVIDHYLSAHQAAAPGTAFSYDLPRARMFMEFGWKNGRLDEQTARKVLRALLSIELKVAPLAARDHTLRYGVFTADWTIPLSNGQMTTAISMTDRQDTLGGITVPAEAISTSSFGDQNRRFNLPIGDAISLSKLQSELPMGRTTYELSAMVTATLAIEDRPTLVEFSQVKLSGSTMIVEPQNMFCPPVTHIDYDESLPIDDPANVEAAKHATPVDAPDPMPSVMLRYGGAKELFLIIEPPQTGAFLGDVILLDQGKRTELGTHLIDNEWLELPLHEEPAPNFEVLINPRPELGVELFNVPTIYIKPVTLRGS